MCVRKLLTAAVAGAGMTVAVAAPPAEPIPAPKPLTVPAAGDPAKLYTFGTLRAMPADAAKAKAVTYLKTAGRFDAKAVDDIWKTNKSVFDKTVATLLVGHPDASKLIDEAKQPDAAAPTEVPKLLKDAATDKFFKANVGTAYAKALAGRRVYEEAADSLRAVAPEEVVDPATYFFYRAVAEHALMQREAATASIVRLLDDVVDTPDRYKMVATLLFFDIQNWSKDQKDFANIGRLMDNSGRRLDLARGGEKTQDIQKKIVFRLDEAIKELEQKQKGQGGGSGSQPGGGNTRPSGPAGDSTIMGGSGEGKVDDKRLKKLAEEWGKLPAAERAKAIQEITRDLPAKYKPMIEEYFKSLNKINGVGP